MSMRMTTEEYKAFQARIRAKYDKPQQPAPEAKPKKYKNVITEVDGFRFDSKAEAHRYIVLREMLRAGEIIGFGMQPSFKISREVRYVPDFIVHDRFGVHVEDVKSPITAKNATFVVKAKLFREKYPWLPLIIIN